VRTFDRTAPLLLVLADAASISGGWFFARWLSGDPSAAPPSPGPAAGGESLGLTVVALLLVSCLAAGGQYRLERTADALRGAARAVGTSTWAALLGIAALLPTGVPALLGPTRVLLTAAAVILAVGAGRFSISSVARELWAGRRLLRRVVLVGEQDQVSALARLITEEPRSGYEVAGQLSPPAGQRGDDEAPSALLSTLERLRPTGIIFILPSPSPAATVAMLLDCRRAGAEIKIVSRREDDGLIPSLSGEICGWPAADVSLPPFYGTRRRIKRFLDLLLAALGLAAALPLLLVLGVLIRRQDGGPALFQQTRVGLRGRRFKMLKLRTMALDGVVAVEANVAEGPLTRIPDDPRITPLGRWLRRHKLDELPQLVNVLAGQMSLVGPRPPTLEEYEQYAPWQRRRLAVPPGLTGLWQIDKLRRWRFSEMVALDLKYILRWSLILDFSVILRTIPVVIRGS
jgi:exopolysaccharide biosynthesis polyprenyl glycosylphosphotransferase